MTDPVWITYAWDDNDEGNFDHLVNTLEDNDVHAVYDKIKLIPGQRLWEQIGEQITEGELTGWAYLLTPQSLNSEACREELEYAVRRALASQSDSFPLLGLLHDVSITDVPPALRVRICVDLSDPTWVEQVRAGLEQRPPDIPREETEDVLVTSHHPYRGNPDLWAAEFRPRFGEEKYWRIAYPEEAEFERVGVGPVGGGDIGGVLTEAIEGEVDLAGRKMNFWGAGNTITPGTAAYIVFSARVPDFLAFGVASEAYGMPDEWMPIRRRS